MDTCSKIVPAHRTGSHRKFWTIFTLFITVPLIAVVVAITGTQPFDIKHMSQKDLELLRMHPIPGNDLPVVAAVSSRPGLILDGEKKYIPFDTALVRYYPDCVSAQTAKDATLWVAIFVDTGAPIANAASSLHCIDALRSIHPDIPMIASYADQSMRLELESRPGVIPFGTLDAWTFQKLADTIMQAAKLAVK